MTALAGQLKDKWTIHQSYYLVWVIMSGLRESTKYADDQEFNLLISQYSKHSSVLFQVLPYVKRYGIYLWVSLQGESTETGWGQANNKN